MLHFIAVSLDCKFLFNYLQFWLSYAILNESTHRIFDLSLELNLQVCLLSKWRHCLQQIWDELPQIAINKAIKRLNAYVSADGGDFSILRELGSRA